MINRLPHRQVEQSSALDALERQQALVLETLRAADGALVSYAALRDAGVEFPASVVSELALAGFQLERCHDGVRRSRATAPTHPHPALDTRRRPSRIPIAQVGVRATRLARARLPTVRLPRASVATLLAGPVLMVGLVIAALAVGGGPATLSGQHTRRALAPRSRSRAAPAAIHTDARSSAPAAGREAEPTPVSLTLATQLEAQGHELLQSGRYSEAIPVLRRALAATGESVEGCLQPASEGCLTYAYALYDLGRALLLHGSPAAAVNVLERRLQIENQRAVVAAELASARSEL